MTVETKEIPLMDDEIGAIVVGEQRESLPRQIELYEKQLTALALQKKDYLEQCEIDEAAWQIRRRDGNHEKLEDKKQFKFELVPEYWECVRKKQDYEYRNHQHTMESTVKGFDHRILEMQEMLESTKEKLAALEVSA